MSPLPDKQADHAALAQHSTCPDICAPLREHQGRNYDLHTHHINPSNTRTLKTVGFDRCYVRAMRTSTGFVPCGFGPPRRPEVTMKTLWLIPFVNVAAARPGNAEQPPVCVAPSPANRLVAPAPVCEPEVVDQSWDTSISATRFNPRAGEADEPHEGQQTMKKKT